MAGINFEESTKLTLVRNYIHQHLLVDLIGKQEMTVN